MRHRPNVRWQGKAVIAERTFDAVCHKPTNAAQQATFTDYRHQLYECAEEKVRLC